MILGRIDKRYKEFALSGLEILECVKAFARVCDEKTNSTQFSDLLKALEQPETDIAPKSQFESFNSSLLLKLQSLSADILYTGIEASGEKAIELIELAKKSQTVREVIWKNGELIDFKG